MSSPFAWSVVFLAIISVLYISSGFLTYYAKKANDEPTKRNWIPNFYRQCKLGWDDEINFEKIILQS